MNKRKANLPEKKKNADRGRSRRTFTTLRDGMAFVSLTNTDSGFWNNLNYTSERRGVGMRFVAICSFACRGFL